MHTPLRVEHAYTQLLYRIRHSGQRRPGTRTGVDTLGVWDERLVADLREGFPLLTTKKIPFASVKAELLGFLRGYESAAQFRALGTRIWDQNANETAAWLVNPYRRGTDDLGRIYGAQWRYWESVPVDAGRPDAYPEGANITDQIANLIHGLIRDPYSRRHIVTAWNPGELGQMALPPCHMLFQCYVEIDRLNSTDILHLKMTQRSADVFLGVPFNLASYALLLQMIATAVNMTPGTVTLDMGDVHLYENHLDQVAEQLARAPRLAPQVAIDPELLDYDHAIAMGHRTGDYRGAFKMTPMDAITLTGYDPHPAIPAPMAA